MPTPRVLVVREHEPLTGLREDEQRDLERFALTQPTDKRGRHSPVLSLRHGRLHAQNYVGIIETRRGTVIEILPKVALSNAGDGTTMVSGPRWRANGGPVWFHDRQGRRHPTGLPHDAAGLARPRAGTA